MELDIGEAVFTPSTGASVWAAMYSPHGVVVPEVTLRLEILDENEKEVVEPIVMGPGFSRDGTGRYWSEFRTPELFGGYIARLSEEPSGVVGQREAIEEYFGVVNVSA